MNIKKTRKYSNATRESVEQLGKQIKLARNSRKLSESDLALQIGISRTTLQKIEKGDLKCEIGITMETAEFLGVGFLTK